jgi:hypothetical protein
MNRRSFITKALAGIAAIPLIGKLVKAQPTLPPTWKGPIDYTSQSYQLGSGGPEIDIEMCRWDFAAAMRERILRDVKERGESNLCVNETSTAFGQWEYEWIDQWCTKHDVCIYAKADGRIVVFPATCAELSARGINWPAPPLLGYPYA